MHITFDSINNSISLDNNTIKITNTDELSFIPSDVLQIYWYDTYGELMYKDKSMKIIDNLEIYDDLVSLYNEEKINLEEKQRLEQLKRDEEFESELKKIEEQNKKLQEEQEQIKKLEEEQNKKNLEEYEKTRDYWKELRQIRNYRLSESDWSQLPDAPITEDQKNAWQEYRQALRDLPENITDPKELVNDQNHLSWPQLPD